MARLTTIRGWGCALVALQGLTCCSGEGGSKESGSLGESTGGADGASASSAGDVQSWCEWSCDLGPILHADCAAQHSIEPEPFSEPNCLPDCLVGMSDWQARAEQNGCATDVAAWMACTMNADAAGFTCEVKPGSNRIITDPDNWRTLCPTETAARDACVPSEGS